MNQIERQMVYALTGIMICIALLAGLWFYGIAPEFKPVWTEQGKITSITYEPPQFLVPQAWNFIVNTENHGVVSPVISDCGWEIVGNTVYVTLLGDGKYAQTDGAGNIICNN